MQTNMFCSRSNLSNEASVETWFVDPLLNRLGFATEDINLKTSLKEYKLGKGSKALWYKPDYAVLANKFPTLIIDAKSPDEDIGNWVQQCASYCLEINRSYEHHPVEFFIVTNGFALSLYRWDKGKPLLDMEFDDFTLSNPKFIQLQNLISKAKLIDIASDKENALLETHFCLEPVTQSQIESLFFKLHRFIWTTENLGPSAAFAELMKIVFVKIKKDRELHERYDVTKLKVGDVVFSLAWIKGQTEHDNPINDPLFKNLVKDLEKEIANKQKRRIFDLNEDIALSPSTIERIVADLEHLDLYAIEEDVHGRMFEIFLAATIRGKELGQFFTPRDIVRLMVDLADIKVTKVGTEKVIDPCCGSGGFLIVALRDMWHKTNEITGLSNKERDKLKANIANDALCGIDAGSNPAMYRIARMNMYLHGDGGSNVYFADSLDKNIGQVGPRSLERDQEIEDLRTMLIKKCARFDVVLANPPFSMSYSRKDSKQRQILDQYSITAANKQVQSLLYSVMFLERYRELAKDDGRILAIIDDSILSGEKYKAIRDYIRRAFIIRGIVSLPGDAFRHAASRVKTSVLILRPKEDGEEQGSAFMEKAVYLGLAEKVAKRLGIVKEELQEGKQQETNRIVAAYGAFEAGKNVTWVIPPDRMKDRLDVKHCIGDRGRKRGVWLSAGYDVVRLEDVLSPPADRKVSVEGDEIYTLLRVTYDGDVIEGETMLGEDLSYNSLLKVEPWDIVFSNMGVGRGAIGVVPRYLINHYVSSEYTLLRASTPEDALFYLTIIRSKEILGDILTVGTGLNRGRARWRAMSDIEIPRKAQQDLSSSVEAIEKLWAAQEKFREGFQAETTNITTTFTLDDESARQRWLSYKPPE